MGRFAERVAAFDRRVDAAFDHLRGRPLVDRAFYTASHLGDHSLIWHLLAAGRGLRRGGDLDDSIRVWALMGLESAIVNGPVKAVFRRSRPVEVVERPHALRQPRTSSFPSGHASAATVFFVVAGQDDDLAAVYAVLAAVVAASRVHVRIHHASDVVGGVLVGLTLGSLFRRWWPPGEALPPALKRSR